MSEDNMTRKYIVASQNVSRNRIFYELDDRVYIEVSPDAADLIREKFDLVKLVPETDTANVSLSPLDKIMIGVPSRVLDIIQSKYNKGLYDLQFNIYPGVDTRRLRGIVFIAIYIDEFIDSVYSTDGSSADPAACQILYDILATLNNESKKWLTDKKINLHRVRQTLALAEKLEYRIRSGSFKLVDDPDTWTLFVNQTTDKVVHEFVNELSNFTQEYVSAITKKIIFNDAVE